MGNRKQSGDGKRCRISSDALVAVAATISVYLNRTLEPCQLSTVISLLTLVIENLAAIIAQNERCENDRKEEEIEPIAII